jgi:3-mercaptopyruvate sulfurtransferase SseA
LCFANAALDAAEEINGNLVTVDWLEKNIKNENVLILDASPPQIYTAQHIPGAINVNIFAYGARKHQMLKWSSLFSHGNQFREKDSNIRSRRNNDGTRLFFTLLLASPRRSC